MEGNSGLVAGMLGLGFLFAFLFFILFGGFFIFYLIGKWKLYEKSGREGWKAIIPFYSEWVYVEMAGLNWWYFLLLIANSFNVWVRVNDEVSLGTGLFGIATLVGTFFCNYNISKKLHKDTGFAVLMTLFSFILIPLIGFSSQYTWDDSVPVSVNGPIDDYNNNKNNNNNNNNDDTNVDKDKKNNKDKKSKFCTNCGAKIESDNKYCSKCGKEI